MFWIKLVAVILVVNIGVAFVKPEIGDAGDVLQGLAYLALVLYVWRQVKARRAAAVVACRPAD